MDSCRFPSIASGLLAALTAVAGSQLVAEVLIVGIAVVGTDDREVERKVGRPGEVSV